MASEVEKDNNSVLYWCYSYSVFGDCGHVGGLATIIRATN